MAIAVRVGRNRGKRPAQAARAAQRDLKARTRGTLLRILGGHDFAIMYGDLCRRGPGAFGRWTQIVTYRLANQPRPEALVVADQPRPVAVVVRDVPRLITDAYVLLGAEREYQERARRILRGEQP